MSSKHTPGPWAIEYRGGHSYNDDSPRPVICNDKLQRIAIISLWGAVNGLAVEMEANAQLIAAAPQLLEAIEGALRISNLWTLGEVDAPFEDEAKALETMKANFEAAIGAATKEK